jgi:hypothetical protein
MDKISGFVIYFAYVLFPFTIIINNKLRIS